MSLYDLPAFAEPGVRRSKRSKKLNTQNKDLGFDGQWQNKTLKNKLKKRNKRNAEKQNTPESKFSVVDDHQSSQ